MTEITEDLTIEAITTVEPDALNDTQKGFLEEHKEELSDEQAEKYGITKEIKQEEIKPEDIKPEVRGNGDQPPAKPVKKEGEDEDDEEVLPEDKKVISRVVGEALGPLQKQLQDQADQAELTNFVSTNPEYAKYKQSIEVYMKHPAYKNIPVKNIAAIVASKDLQKLGAQKEREAREAAEATRGGGSTARSTPGQKDWSTASKEEFEAKKAEVFGRH
jgi:hypothetical protein